MALKKSLNDISDSEFPHGHKYPVSIIQLAMLLRTNAGFAYRAISKGLKIFLSFINIPISVPHFTTIRLWSLRLGLSRLNKDLVMADDWIYIIDASIKCGPRKCLVILGIRQSVFLQKKDNLTLKQEDMTVIDVYPCKKLTGEVVDERLHEASKLTGCPISIVLDRGGEMKKGIHLFKLIGQLPEKFFYIFDIPHKLASLFEATFSNCDIWKEFSKKVTFTKLQVAQTDLASIAPPGQRSISRYMNVDIQVNWAAAVIRAKKEGKLDCFPYEKVIHCFGWLDAYEQFVTGCEQIVQIGDLIKKEVRENGIHKQMYIKVEEEILKKSLANEIVIKFANDALKMLKEEVDKVPEGFIGIGTTEILESAFGKYKELSHQHRGNLEISSNTLSIPLFMGKQVSQAEIKEGLETSTCSSLFKWCKEKVGETMAGARRKLLGNRKNHAVN